MKSVLLPFYTNMELEVYSEKNRRTLLDTVVRYLVGCARFKDTRATLADMGCLKPFQLTLRSFTPPYQRLYRTRIRKFLRGRDVKVHEFDAYHLEPLKKNLKEKVKVIAYPTEDSVIKSMSPAIGLKTFRLGGSRKVQRMTHVGIEDIKQSVYMRVLQTYRTYLPSVGKFLPQQALFRILHSAVESTIIDSLRGLDANKSQITVPFAMLGSDFEENIDLANMSAGRFYFSPEAALQAKESICLDFHEDTALMYSAHCGAY